MPVRTEIQADFSLHLVWIKVPIMGYAISHTGAYRLRDDLRPSFWDGEYVRVEEHMNAAGNARLEAERPLPLDETESLDYQLKDSLKEWRSSDAYLDSLTRTENWFTAQNLILIGLKKKNYRLKV